MINSATQSWRIGQLVDVGFVKGLQVVEMLPRVAVDMPDSYVLKRLAGGLTGTLRWYRFTPHRGLQRRDSLADARKR